MGEFFGKHKKQGGFTLIEIVIALAIAGLIFVVIFLAVTGAQRARRDDNRRAAAARLLAAIEEQTSSNNGTPPTACPADPEDWNAPTGISCSTTAGSASLSVIEYDASAGGCSGNAFATATNSTSVAVRVLLEGAGVAYCLTND